MNKKYDIVSVLISLKDFAVMEKSGVKKISENAREFCLAIFV